MISLPIYLGISDYKIQSADDILRYIPMENISGDDIIWLEGEAGQGVMRVKLSTPTVPMLSSEFAGDTISGEYRML